MGNAINSTCTISNVQMLLRWCLRDVDFTLLHYFQGLRGYTNNKVLTTLRHVPNVSFGLQTKLAFNMHECLSYPTFLRLAEEKKILLKQCEESVSAKVEEMEQINLRLEEAQQDLLLTKNQVCLWAAAQCFLLSSFILI